MKTWGVIPAKPLWLAKSRLSVALSSEERAGLVTRMLEHTLEVVCDFELLNRVLVVSADPQLWRIARKAGADVLEEPDTPGLNKSLERASLFVQEKGGDRLLVIHSDLPRLNRAELGRMLPADAKPPFVAVAPDRHHHGTNVLTIAPPGLIPFRYGRFSYLKHCRSAVQAGAAVYVIESSDLAFDVDCPEDTQGLV